MMRVINGMKARHHFNYDFDKEFRTDQKLLLKRVHRALETGVQTVFAEHFYYPDNTWKRAVEYINVLRNPVDRCVSAYYYSRFGDNSKEQKEWVKKRFGMANINDCLKQSKVGEVPACLNCDTQILADYLCGPKEVCQDLDEQEKLAYAVKNLQNRYTVGLTEHMSESMELFHARFPTFFKGAKRKLLQREPQRSTSDDPRYVKPSEDTRRKLEALLKADMELYQLTADKFWREYRGCVKHQLKYFIKKRAIPS